MTRIFDTHAAAQRAGVSERTIRRWVAADLLHPLGTTRHYFREDELLAAERTTRRAGRIVERRPQVS